MKRGIGTLPLAGLILLGIVSIQVGAGVAKILFRELPPSAVVLLRVATAAVLLALLVRPRLRGHTRRQLRIALAFGVSLAVMNFSIYESFSRIPLGIAVTIEFLGPLAVAVAGSRRPVDLVWVLLAAAGVTLLGPLGATGEGRVTWAGIGFALLAGAAWACYILLSAATGRAFAGSAGLSLALVVSTVLIAPVGVATGGTDLIRPELIAVGAAVGLLSTVIPYTIEMETLRRVPARVFGILMSLEPAVAAMVGLVLLGEILRLHEWVGISCVVLACVGAARSTPDAVHQV